MAATVTPIADALHARWLLKRSTCAQALGDAVEGFLRARDYSPRVIKALLDRGLVREHPRVAHHGRSWGATPAGVAVWDRYCNLPQGGPS